MTADIRAKNFGGGDTADIRGKNFIGNKIQKGG